MIGRNLNPDDAGDPALTLEEAEMILRRLAGLSAAQPGGFKPSAPSRDTTQASVPSPTAGRLSGRAGGEPPAAPPVEPAPPFRAEALSPAASGERVWDRETLWTVLELVPDALVVIDAAGAIVLVNRRTEELFGYPRDELQGRPVELLIPERFRLQHVAQRAAYVSDPHVRPMGAGLSLFGRRRDGREFPVEISLSPMPTPQGLLVTATVRDISVRRQAEAQLRNAEARYRTLVEEIPAVTFMAALDPSAAEISGLYVSPQIEALLGFSQKEWLEDPVLWYSQLHPDDRERWHVEFARTCAEGEPFDAVYRFIARDGRVVWVHGHAQVVRDRDGHPLFLQGVAFDITDRREAEEAMRLLNETLERRVAEAVAAAEQRAQELARSNEDLDRFASIASHDLREPLRTIMRYMQRLERQFDAQTDAAARENVARAIHNARQMNQLIDDLHLHARISRDEGFAPVDCADALAEACGNLRAVLEESGATVTADPLPVVVGVRPQLVLLFQNLVQNAVKFRGGREPEIQVSVRRQVDEWQFEMRDNGIGIEPEFLEKIFEVGRRLHGRNVPGTGFGLANCRRIVEHHGGRMWAESTPGVGSTFCFRLRAAT